MGSLVSTATDITTKALQIKLSYIHNKLEELAQLVTENPRQATPPELSFIRYEEWLETNQQLFEYNCQLFDLERVKFEVKKKQEAVRQAIAARGGRERAGRCVCGGGEGRGCVHVCVWGGGGRGRGEVVVCMCVYVCVGGGERCLCVCVWGGGGGGGGKVCACVCVWGGGGEEVFVCTCVYIPAMILCIQCVLAFRISIFEQQSYRVTPSVHVHMYMCNKPGF